MSFWKALNLVLSGGALRERVGRCRGRRAVQVFGGGERRVESIRLCLGEGVTVELLSVSASSGASCSISVSRVTITGRLTGLEFLRPKVKPDLTGGYNGIGDTSTVRSVIVNDDEQSNENTIVQGPSCVYL